MYHMPSTALQSATIWVFFNEVKIYFVTDLYHVAHASSKDYGGRGEHCHLKNNYLKLSIYCILIMFFHPLPLLPDSPYFPTHSTLYSPPLPRPKKNNMKNNKNQTQTSIFCFGYEVHTTSDILLSVWKRQSPFKDTVHKPSSV